MITYLKNKLVKKGNNFTTFPFFVCQLSENFEVTHTKRKMNNSLSQQRPEKGKISRHLLQIRNSFYKMFSTVINEHISVNSIWKEKKDSKDGEFFFNFLIFTTFWSLNMSILASIQTKPVSTRNACHQ